MVYHPRMNHYATIGILSAVLVFLLLPGCACSSCGEPSASGSPAAPTSAQAGKAQSPPPAIQAWMDRLTVKHAYDPQTGFIVAREVITLPPILAEAPALDEAVAQSIATDRPLIVFTTADRCAPCQQYKRDAMNNDRVIVRLSQPHLLATHVEVDRNPDAARRHLGGLAIPMTYLLRDGKVVATLRGQRSASDLLEWMDEHEL